MSIVALTLGLWVVAGGDPMEPYRGRPVLTVEVEAPADEDPTELRELIDIRPGYLLTSVDVQDAQKRLYALGRFASVSVLAERRAGTVSLRFVLAPLQRLANLDIEGVESVDVEGLRSALGLRVGDEVDRRTQAVLQSRAKAHLSRLGFPRATVEIEEEGREPERRELIMRVVENAPLRIGSVGYVGAPRVAADILRVHTESRVGDVLDVERLERDRQALTQVYLERGFRRVDIGPATCARPGEPALVCAVFVETLSERSPDSAVAVHFPIVAGDRIDVIFRGNRLLSDGQLIGAWPEQDGRLRRGSLPVLRERILDLYRRLGFARCQVELRGLRDDTQGIIRYIFVIDEGPPIELRHLEFVGAEVIAPEVLVAQVRAKLRDELDDDGLIESLEAAERDALLVPGEDGSDGRAVQPLPVERRYVQSVIDAALEDVRAVYRDRGFLRSTVSAGSPELDRDGRSMDLRVHVAEGPRTDVKTLRFVGNVAFTSTELLELAAAADVEKDEEYGLTDAGLELGSPLSESAVERARIRLLRAYRNQGYLYARIFANTVLSADGGSADVAYRFEEGPQVRIARVLIRGQRFTLESLVRSRLRLKSGDIYRLESALEAQRTIAALGVFSSVRVKLIDEERPAEFKDLVAEVVERNRQPVEIGAGVSTADGARVMFSYQHINMFGTASTFTLTGKANVQLFYDLYGDYAETIRERYKSYNGVEIITKALERQLRAGIRSPELIGLPWSPTLRLDVFHERDNAVPFSFETWGSIFGIDLEPHPALRISIEPQAALTGLECPLRDDASVGSCQDAVTAARPGLQTINEGDTRTIKIGPTFTLDLRDNPLNPTRGFFSNFSAQYAVGDSRATANAAAEPFSFIKLDGGATGYIGLWRPVLVLSARLGTIRVLGDGGVPIDERFFIGGRDTLRGFVEQTLIPQDACVLGPDEERGSRGSRCAEEIRQGVDPDGNPVPPVSGGGHHYFAARGELRIPLTEAWSLNLFADAANLWVALPSTRTSTLRFGTGAGLRYATPVGALVLDVGFNPFNQPRRGEALGPLFHFAIGSL